VAYCAVQVKVSLRGRYLGVQSFIEVHVVKDLVEEDSLRTKAKDALDTAKEWNQRIRGKRLVKTVWTK
jgi:hypothetical protein